MNDELKSLIEDAAKLLGLGKVPYNSLGLIDARFPFDPFDPERGDLMKVAEAAELMLDFETRAVVLPITKEETRSMPAEFFIKGDHQSLTLAVLRAASAVYKSRGGE